jgi:hypothetical protein
VDVVALDGVVHETEAATLARGAEASLERVDEQPEPQRRHALPHLERDVAGMPRGERRAAGVRIAAYRTRLAARTLAPPSPTAPLLERELELPGTSRHREHRRTEL